MPVGDRAITRLAQDRRARDPAEIHAASNGPYAGRKPFASPSRTAYVGRREGTAASTNVRDHDRPLWPPTVEQDGERRDDDLPGRQGRLALAYLALNRDRPVSREELVEAVWAEAAGQGSAQGLNVVLSKLRRALGPEVLEGARTQSVQLAPHVVVDLQEATATPRRCAGRSRGETGRR